METRRRGEGSSTRGQRWGRRCPTRGSAGSPGRQRRRGVGVSPPASGGVEPCHHLGDLGPLELCTSRFLSFGATKFEVTGHGNNGKPAPEINQFSGQQRWEIRELSPRMFVPENREHFTVLPKRSPSRVSWALDPRRQPQASGVAGGFQSGP